MKDNSVHQNCENILDGRITFGVPCIIYSKHAAVCLQRAPTVHVGGPAYVQTCVLSGSRGTAGVLAQSLNTIFKPLCGSIFLLQQCIWNLLHCCFVLQLFGHWTDCSFHLSVIHEINSVGAPISASLYSCLCGKKFLSSDLSEWWGVRQTDEVY